MFGRVRLYNFGFALFTVGSALCSLSQSSVQLIGFRLVQALGAGFLFSNSAAIITDAFPQEQRGMALGINQVSIVVGSVLGLVLGGLLTSAAGWRSIFWVNIPIGAFATAWSHYQLKELATINKDEKLDLLGNFSFAGGIALILTGITLYVISSLSLPQLIAMSAAGAALLVLFVFVERRVAQPMFDLSLFRIRMFTAGNIAIFLNALARGAVSLVLVFYLQGPTMGLSPLTAGIFLVPISLSLAFFGPISGWLSDRYGARFLSSMGLAVSSAGFILLTGIGPTITFQQLSLPLIFVGGWDGAVRFTKQGFDNELRPRN
jgi:MFS family permease